MRGKLLLFLFLSISLLEVRAISPDTVAIDLGELTLSDSLEIKHTAHSRQGFALGALMAAEWLAGKKERF